MCLLPAQPQHMPRGHPHPQELKMTPIYRAWYSYHKNFLQLLAGGLSKGQLGKEKSKTFRISSLSLKFYTEGRKIFQMQRGRIRVLSQVENPKMFATTKILSAPITLRTLYCCMPQSSFLLHAQLCVQVSLPHMTQGQFLSGLFRQAWQSHPIHQWVYLRKGHAIQSRPVGEKSKSFGVFLEQFSPSEVERCRKESFLPLYIALSRCDTWKCLKFL